MRTPTIHLNGNLQDTLLDEASEALHKLSDAREALCRITVHGRNFYPQDYPVNKDATGDAIRQFRAMLERFDSVVDEVQRYQQAVADGGAQISQFPADRLDESDRRG